MANESNNGREFLGAGIAFPLGVNADGHLAMHSLDDQVRQSIFLILQTGKGERVMRPDFGAGLQAQVFDSITPTTITLVQHRVEEALIRFEPRIEVLKVEVNSDQKESGVLLINISYRVRRTDISFNLVYPFYIERGEL